MTVNRLVVRLVVSHLLVAAVGALATFAIVRAVAPPLFDRALRRGPGGPGPGSGRLLVQEQFTSAVDTSLLLGVGAGVAAAAILGAAAAYRLTRPLDALGEATRRMASGDYATDVPQPGTKELDDLADDIRGLGGSLAQTEARRIRLLGEVAHEMRTPLTVVDGYVEGIIDGVLPADDATLGLLSSEVRRLRRLADDEGRTVVVVLHDINYAAAWADRIVALRNGALVAAGSPEEVIRHEVLEQIYGVRIGVTRHEGRLAALYHWD